MNPITYVELNSPQLAGAARFFTDVFGWDLQPFAAPDYLVAPGRDAGGIDAAVLQSRDGNPRVVPVINVESLSAVAALAVDHGAAVVVAPFVIPGVGRGCYIVEPTGLLIGLHENNPDVSL